MKRQIQQTVDNRNDTVESMLAQIHNETWPTWEKLSSRIENLPEHTYIDRIEKLLFLDSKSSKETLFFVWLLRDIIIHKKIPGLKCGKGWKTGEIHWKVRCYRYVEGFTMDQVIYFSWGCMYGCSLHNSFCLFVTLKWLTVTLIPVSSSLLRRRGRSTWQCPFSQWSHGVGQTHLVEEGKRTPASSAT